MSSEHLVGTSIPRFTFDTPTRPGNDFYALCEGEQPLVMIFLPAFDHPVTREYLTHYLKTCARLRGVRLACVVRSSARTVAQATQGAEFPFPIICDAPGVLYSYLGVESPPPWPPGRKVPGPAARTRPSPCRTWWGGTMWITTGKTDRCLHKSRTPPPRECPAYCQ